MKFTMDTLIQSADLAKDLNRQEDWETIEDHILKMVTNQLYIELTRACCVREAAFEPLVTLIMGETHPMAIEAALTDARDRLIAKGALSDDIGRALAHSLDYIKNKRKYMEEFEPA